MNFIQAIRDATKLARGLKKGLQALERRHRKKIQVGDWNQLKGSVNIDDCLKRECPADPRWDYVFGYKNKIYYVEVHRAKGVEDADSIKKKMQWLKDWRKKHATALDNLERSSEYYWISTNGIKMMGSHPKQLVKNGILPQSRLNIP